MTESIPTELKYGDGLREFLATMSTARANRDAMDGARRRIQAIADPMERVALATRVFGRGWHDVIYPDG